MKHQPILLLLLVLASCSTIEKSNDRAVRRVLADSALTEFIGRLWADANPCVTDTAFSTDSVEVEVPITVITDSAGKWRDYLYWGDTSQLNPTERALRPTVRVKAPVAYVRDDRALGLARDTIDAMVHQLNFLTAAYELRDSLSREEKQECARSRVELEIRHQKELAEARGSAWMRLLAPLLAIVAGLVGWRQGRKQKKSLSPQNQ